MPLSPLAGLPAPPSLLIDTTQLERAYYDRKPDLSDPAQLVSFGTSGHRGTPLNGTFTESHILAITQAICDYRKQPTAAAHGATTGPIFMGKDTHAASAPAERTALEVLAANYVETIIQEKDGFTPTPVISHAILTHNRALYKQPNAALADGIVITPSHNPPGDGGFKYNPPDGGPADTAVTNWIQKRANEILHDSCIDVKRIPYDSALKAATTHARDLARPYIEDLGAVIDMGALRSAGLKIGVDPLGGSSLAYWEPIAERYGLKLTVVNPKLDPRFAFMTVDHDGKIRMDCSSPYAMAGLAGKISAYDIAWGNDPDADRHGIVTRSSGLMNPNHYLAVAIQYLLSNRPNWPVSAVVGKTVVSSSIIDRVVADRKRTLWEVPVGFKWFSPGLFDGKCCFGGEESAGASFLRRDGTAWTTDKDGLILGLLSAEICAKTSRDPGEHYKDLVSRYGESFYTRIDASATLAQREALKHLAPKDLAITQLAGDSITATLTNAPGNDAPIGGLKVITKNGWFAARPSGTEDICKLYAESLRSADHLNQIVTEAQAILAATVKA